MREREGETMILECDECHSDTEILYKVDGQEICADCLSDYLEQQRDSEQSVVLKFDLKRLSQKRPFRLKRAVK